MALAFLRRHRAWFNWFLVAIILSFIFLYIPTDFEADPNRGNAVLAQVGDESITVAEYQRAFLDERDRLREMYQGRLDDDMMRRLAPGLREQTLQGLIDRRVLLLEARRLGLEVDDQAVAQRIMLMPEFSRNGRFVGAQEFQQRLKRMGRSEKDYAEGIRLGLLAEKLMTLVTSPVTVSPGEAEQEYRRRNEQVRAEYVLVPANVSEVNVTDDEVKAHFTAHPDQYRFPERRVVSYLLLDGASMQSRATVTDREVESYYESNPEEYSQPEEACARHIQVKVKATPEAEGHSEEEARKLAQAALDQVKGGADFAAVAGKVSEDKGTSSRGGDLGCFARGQLPPPLDAALFALQPGQVSDLVRVESGFHIIRAESKKDSTQRPLAEVREGIRQSLLSQKVRDLTEEKATAIAASLRKGSAMADVGREQGLPVQKSAPLSRGEGAAPLTSPALVGRVFEMKRGEVESEPFPVGAGYAFVALDEVQGPRAPELKEVQDRVKADLLLQKALEAARVRAADVKARADKDGLEKAALGVGLVRKETQGLVSRGQAYGDLGAAATLDEAAFNLAPNAVSEPVRLPRGYAVIRVLEKKPVDSAAFAREKESLVSSLTDERRGQMFRAYLVEARKRFPVEKRTDVLRRAAAG
jgi:peptidyl-prolyl cis-trans isomerase D